MDIGELKKLLDCYEDDVEVVISVGGGIKHITHISISDNRELLLETVSEGRSKRPCNYDLIWRRPR